MKKLLIPIIAVAALGASMSAASAQSWNGQRDYSQGYRDQGTSWNYGQNYDGRGQYGQGGQGRYGQGQGNRGGRGQLNTAYVDSLDWRIANAAQEGRISWSEARQLRAEVRAVHDMAWRVETGQARPAEVNRVQQVVSRVERAVGGPYTRGGNGRRN